MNESSKSKSSTQKANEFNPILPSNQENEKGIAGSDENQDGSSISPSKSILKSKSKDNFEKKKSVGFTINKEDNYEEGEEEKSSKSKKKKQSESDFNYQGNSKNENSYISDIKSPPVVHNLSVGKVQDGIAVLLSEDFNIIEMPLSILPPDVRKGNIIKVSIERNIAEEEARKNSIKDIQNEIIQNDHLFDDFNRKLDYFKNKKMQLLQASSKGVPNVQKTLETVIGTLKETSIIDETIDNDRIMVRPKAVTDIRLEKPNATNKQNK